MHYARWQGGEADIVQLDQKQKPKSVVEVKWSDLFARKPGDLRSLLSFCETNGLGRATVTSRTVTTSSTLRDIELTFIPASVYCFMIGLTNIMWKHVRGAHPDLMVQWGKDDGRDAPPRDKKGEQQPADPCRPHRRPRMNDGQ